ncbi:MAG: hypothetical protein HYS18_01405 [Burkholderiales bacterium]|nr:hypothetical protein [Burkholderiales bacterium]
MSSVSLTPKFSDGQEEIYSEANQSAEANIEVVALKTAINALEDKLWFTRKARIYAEKRLLDFEFHAQLLLIVYSIYIVALSVVLLKFKLINTI